jgi:hypothetical protein
MTDGLLELGGLSLQLRHTKCCALHADESDSWLPGTIEGITTTVRSATGFESCLGFQHSNWCSIDDRIRGRATTNATGSDDNGREMGALARTD